MSLPAPPSSLPLRAPGEVGGVVVNKKLSLFGPPVRLPICENGMTVGPAPDDTWPEFGPETVQFALAAGPIRVVLRVVGPAPVPPTRSDFGASLPLIDSKPEMPIPERVPVCRFRVTG